MSSQDTRERLAEYAHDVWAGQMKHLLNIATRNSDGTVTLPAWAVSKWTREAHTPYKALTEERKNGYRADADAMLSIIVIALTGE